MGGVYKYLRKTSNAVLDFAKQNTSICLDNTRQMKRDGFAMADAIILKMHGCTQ